MADTQSLNMQANLSTETILEASLSVGAISSGGLTTEQIAQLDAAYQHSQTDNVTDITEIENTISTYVTAHKEELKGDKGDKGDTGAKGEKGDTGANGITPTLKVGSTSTGNAGTNASVTMTDSNNVYTLNFVIPKGDKGDAGVKGQDGAKGADGITPTLRVGTVTTLAAGSNATVTMSENNNVYTLNFGIPKGNKGDTGAAGGSGETTVINPTITIGTVTNGDTASATITGDSPNYTLNLVLPKGAKGDKGEKGDAGVKGADGAKGDKGDKGDPFTYADFTPEQLATLKGAKGDKGDTGAKGEKGDTGVKGADGITPTIAVGTTTTGEAGTNANVTMSKSGTTYTFNFVIPKGAAGTNGAKGDKGDKGDAGAKGDKGDPFTYADFTPEQLTALKGAKGDKGDKGDTGTKGADGQTPTISIGTVTTGAAGSSASAEITGTTPNLTLNLTIPKGDKGDKGAQGESINKTVSVKSSSSTVKLTDESYQYLKGSTNITITLPSISTSTDITEIHLFYTCSGAYTLKFPSSIKWQGTLPTIEAGKYYEFILTRLHNGVWLAGVVVYG